mmetsp:Transcript_30253/g.56508  ORF Transcript_30253/g.56508 Transcript_30253/m.56508 type:complete len:123 (+) Transcript_30253:575-943(+)
MALRLAARTGRCLFDEDEDEDGFEFSEDSDGSAVELNDLLELEFPSLLKPDGSGVLKGALSEAPLAVIFFGFSDDATFPSLFEEVELVLFNSAVARSNSSFELLKSFQVGRMLSSSWSRTVL